MSQTHTGDKTIVEACPECGSASFRVRNTGHIEHDNTDPYRCSDCHETFSNSANRPQKQKPPERRGLAGRLATMDSDDV